jgi:hypothetical protein
MKTFERLSIGVYLLCGQVFREASGSQCWENREKAGLSKWGEWQCGEQNGAIYERNKIGDSVL